MIVHGKKDQIVPISSSIEIFENLNVSKKELILVNGYYHDLFKGSKVKTLSREIEKFLVNPKYKLKEFKKDL